MQLSVKGGILLLKIILLSHFECETIRNNSLNYATYSKECHYMNRDDQQLTRKKLYFKLV